MPYSHGRGRISRVVIGNLIVLAAMRESEAVSREERQKVIASWWEVGNNDGCDC